MANENKVVLINTGKFGPELQPDGTGFSADDVLESGDIRLSFCREAEIDTKRLLPGISTRLVDRQSLQAGIAAKQALSILPDGTGAERAGVILGSSFGASASMYDFFHKIVTEGSVSISPMEFPNTVSNAAASRVGMWFSLKGHCVSISNGNLSGLDAVGYACREIRNKVMDYYLVGGSEEIPEVVRKIYAKVTGEERQADLSNGVSREILYEGAAMLFLASADLAKEKELKPIAEITGYRSGTVLEKSSGPVLDEMRRLMEGCDFNENEVLFGAGVIPSGELSYSVINETIKQYGLERVLIHNRFGDTLVNYFASEGIMGINEVIKKMADIGNSNRKYQKAIVFNVENDGRFSAVAIQLNN